MYKSYLETNTKSDCSGCTTCSLVCPVNAITMVEDLEGFLYPQINKNKCTNCRLCINKCCFKKFEHQLSRAQGNDVLCYGAINKNDSLRRISSSGAFFPALAKHVILHNGYVVGAAFDKNNLVNHIIINTIEKIELLQGSKYVASCLNNIFSDVKKLLDDKKLVLFTGTPCQNSGLLNYLGKTYNNLITVDLICHGTPSPKIYRDYLRFIESKYHDKIKNVIFRDKLTGWHDKSITINMFSNNYTRAWARDPFLTLFFKDYSQRPSCYQCRFTRHERVSDITIGDFWGIEKSYSQLDDNKGTSFIIINSSKGVEIFDKIKDDFTYKKVYLSDSKQPMLNYATVMPKNRSKFFDIYLNKGITSSFRKYAGYNLHAEIIFRLKKVTRKLINFIKGLNR